MPAGVASGRAAASSANSFGGGGKQQGGGVGGRALWEPFLTTELTQLMEGDGPGGQAVSVS